MDQGPEYDTIGIVGFLAEFQKTIKSKPNRVESPKQWKVANSLHRVNTRERE